jgi:hypothetical protein
MPSYTAKLPDLNFRSPPGFNYTTPSHWPKRGVPEREAAGCEFKYVYGKGGKRTKRFSGRQCLERETNADGEEICVKKITNTWCKGYSNPCGDPKKPRKTCPVQLVWVHGKPNLRFCKTPGKPGYLVPVKDPTEAARMSAEACKKWPYQLGPSDSEDVEWDESYFDRNAPGISRSARRAYPKSPHGEGLGRAQPGPEWMQGEAGAWVTFLVPIGALLTYLAVVSASKR